MIGYTWKCPDCSKSYRTKKAPSRPPVCPDCGQALVAIPPATPVPRPQANLAEQGVGSSSSLSSRGWSRPADPQQAIAMASSSSWVPGSEPIPSPQSPAAYSSARTDVVGGGARFPVVWVAVAGVVLALTAFIVFIAGRSHPKTVADNSTAPPQQRTLPKLETPAPTPPAPGQSNTPDAGGVRSAVEPSTAASGVGRVVNLLLLVDPARDAHSGTWRLRTGELSPELTSDGAQHARMNIPYDPPEEYDFRVDFTRTSGDNCMTQIFTHQKQACLVVYGWKGTVTGFQQINDQSAERNPTGVRGLPTENGQRHTSVVKVRKNSIEAWLDGKLITRYETDGSDLASKDWQVERALGIGTQQSPTVFHRIELTELSGPGHPSAR